MHWLLVWWKSLGYPHQSKIDWKNFFEIKSELMRHLPKLSIEGLGKILCSYGDDLCFLSVEIIPNRETITSEYGQK
jgi:hypothetical protein